MCLVLIGWRAHPEYRLIVAANRDEYYTRPTESMQRWTEVPGLLAGRDIGARGRSEGDPPGTWLGLNERDGRFAAVTNVRNPNDERADARSRGELLMNFLRGAADRNLPGPEKYVVDVAAGPDDYNGYNVVVSDLEQLWWHSNRSAAPPRELTPGFHGLCNGTFATSARPGPASEPEAPQAIWPKVRHGLAGLRKVVESAPDSLDDYFDVLSDPVQAPDELLPHTGVPLENERALSARFVAHPVHGTRASTVLLVRENGTFEIAERSFGRFGNPQGESAFRGTVSFD
ncbi:NRDE family protein [Nocardia sp. NPDC005366]|uniref:NRDE family protein n=1 Tax=Nocardia sp. NPDC005366 TaxID=3156878 RepID=UPI0033ABA994